MNKARKVSQNKDLPTMDQLDSIMKAAEESSAQLQPIIDFHKAMESAEEDDIRMHWDIKIVRGKDTPFASVQGSTSMPRMLARKMVPLAPGNIEKEVHQKITSPLMETVLDELGFEVPGVEKSPSQQ